VPSRHLSLKPRPPQAADFIDVTVLQGLTDVRKEMEVPAEFPAEVLSEAEATARAPQLQHRDETAIPFVTIDPATSRDLDQAVHIERRGSHYRVHYAIADVAAYVAPGDAIDREAWRRVQTLYGPDRRTSLHPTVLSEDATSLLPDVVRPALLWQIDLDSAGQQRAASVHRSLVRSRAKLSYEEVQHRLDTDRADESLLLLREVGLLREEAEQARGGLTLPVPEQQIVRNDGAWSLIFRAPLPVENWNAQISLLAGMAAAQMMLDGKVGIIRTLPRADRRDIDRLRRMARALRVSWAEGLSYQDFVRSLDARNASHAALLAEAATLLRGAAYLAFDGTPPAETKHAAIAAPYAHATAPLRRLVDRFVGEVCVALSADTDVPEWARAVLPLLAQTMADGNRRASAYQRACIDLVEAALLANRIGEEFQGVVVDIHESRPYGVVQVDDPAISGRVLGDHLPLGVDVLVRLVEASIAHRKVIFDLVG
jgi:VacB/RNase II family 3'-5' exoribonuclease